MSPSGPRQDELLNLAAAALADAAGGEAQATATWQAELGTPQAEVEPEIVVTWLADGRVGRGADLAAAQAACRRGTTGVAGLPEPGGARLHTGYAPLPAARAGLAHGGVAKVAVVSTRGVRAFEQRSYVTRTCPGGWAVAAPAVDGLPPWEDDLPATDAGPVPTRVDGVVLGHGAVAWILDTLRPRFGSGDEGTLGTRVAAACISLSDSPRFATTLPRSLDAHGSPRQPVPLVQDGVAHRRVSVDTGHAVRAGEAEARADHLVLVGGGAGDVTELLAPLECGVYLVGPELAYAVEHGSIAHRVEVTELEIDPETILATAQSLTAAQRTVPVGHDPATVGATVCPALRAGAGASRRR